MVILGDRIFYWTHSGLESWPSSPPQCFTLLLGQFSALFPSYPLVFTHCLLRPQLPAPSPPSGLLGCSVVCVCCSVEKKPANALLLGLGRTSLSQGLTGGSGNSQINSTAETMIFKELVELEGEKPRQTHHTWGIHAPDNPHTKSSNKVDKTC